ncbi:MAG: tRNA pseudouridine(55) synthase TruB [Chitinophagales bacterium]|jgi:tRNA pseudouridine55 synthase|nr:tRNA pseudouridine(55) synthase TruB [Chitinophagales bacterium]HNI43288.1 tRNA pseudouridine(55) synthase TruB [Chitinophagales bacterium]
MKKTQFDFEQGEILLVDKPLRWTSFDVVNKIKHATKQRKVGHGGTLDPMATGLLVICIGRAATKRLDEFQNDDKTYTGTITLGATRPSYDLETPITEAFDIGHISAADVREVARLFHGEMEQLPPIYSAIKKDGKPLYESARKGIAVEVEARKIVIHRFEITSVELPDVHFLIRCSKGTYIRSIAHDFGQALQNGAYLSALRRTQSGNFDIAEAWNLDELVEVLRRDRTETK